MNLTEPRTFRVTKHGPKSFEVKKTKLALKYTKYGDRVKKFLNACGKGLPSQTRRRRDDEDDDDFDDDDFDDEITFEELASRIEQIKNKVF